MASKVGLRLSFPLSTLLTICQPQIRLETYAKGTPTMESRDGNLAGVRSKPSQPVVALVKRERGLGKSHAKSNGKRSID